MNRLIYSFVLLAGVGLNAQVFTSGTILGNVKDPSGGAIPGATVSISQEGTEFRRETTTDGQGNYRMLELPIGNYRVEFEKQGFAKVVQTGVSLSAGQSLRVDSKLNVGSITQTVTVGTNVAQVDTDTANVGNTVYGSQVQELALSTRSFSTLVILEPGVLSNEVQQPTVGSSLSFSFNGAPQSSNNWLLDGGRNLDPYNGNNQTMVNLDAIAEVHIERNPYSAEFGRDGGAQINVIIRSGSNSFHGTLFEFFRNDVLNARNFFSTNIKPETRYNNFGGTVGGPIKKDKLFFFLSNEYRYTRTGSTQTAIVPTAQELAGNFTGVRTIKDPLTGQAFPNDIIPASRLNSNAESLLQTYYPVPTPGFQLGGLNYTSSAATGINYHSALGKVNYYISPTLTFAGHFNIDDTPQNYPFASSTIPYVAGYHDDEIFYTASGTLNWIPTPRFINDFTMAYYHGSIGIETSPLALRSRDPAFNVPRYFNTATDSSEFIPSIIPSQGYASINIVNQQNISHFSFEAVDHASYIVGNHTFQFGGGVDRESKTQDNNSPNNNGTFYFNGSATGDSLADMLLGNAYEYTESSTHLTGTCIFTDPSFYAQDRFHVLPNLTITYGVRWEYFQPERDYAGTMSFFNPALFNFSQAAVVQSNGQIVPGTQNFSNGLVVVGKNAEYGYALTNAVHNAFDPRVGFSYGLTKDNKTVLRGGYGIFHDRWAIYASQARRNYPFNQSISIYNTSFNSPTAGQLEILPLTLSNFYSPWQVPYMQKWSMDIERQLPGDLLLDVGYVGSRGIHFVRTIDANQPVASAVVASGMISANAVRPYPGWGAINDYETNGNSLYNSLQVSVVKRFAHGFSIQSAYTYSKSMDDIVTPVDSYAASQPEWALSSFDRTHVWTSSYVWALPFGGNWTGWKERLLHGWQVSAISNFESGNPLNITIPGDSAGSGDPGSERPNVVGQVQRIESITQWFTTSAFAVPAAGTFGSAGRDIVRGPGVIDWDTSFSKMTKIHENVSLQFRAEFFNLFNHTQFSSVGTVVGSSTFGQVTGALNPRIAQVALRLVF